MTAMGRDREFRVLLWSTAPAAEPSFKAAA
jgi:hypothetical protein